MVQGEPKVTVYLNYKSLLLLIRVFINWHGRRAFRVAARVEY
jgi:hypothetical protein